MYQKTILIGRIGKNELAYTPKNNTPVTQYSVVTTESRKDKQSGDWVEYDEWHRLVSFNKCAEHVGQKLKPGDLIQVEGRWQTRKWQDAQGNDRYIKELVVNDFPKKLPRFFTRDGQSAPANQAPANSSQPMQQAVGQNSMQQEPPFDSFDDDIPF